MEWNKNKCRQNFVKHGLAFSDTHHVFDEFYIEKLDTRKDYLEVRYIVLGLLFEREVVLVYTPRNKKKRIISMRKVNAREKKIYQKERLKALRCND